MCQAQVMNLTSRNQANAGDWHGKGQIQSVCTPQLTCCMSDVQASLKDDMTPFESLLELALQINELVHAFFRLNLV